VEKLLKEDPFQLDVFKKEVDKLAENFLIAVCVVSLTTEPKQE